MVYWCILKLVYYLGLSFYFYKNGLKKWILLIVSMNQGDFWIEVLKIIKLLSKN